MRSCKDCCEREDIPEGNNQGIRGRFIRAATTLQALVKSMGLAVPALGALLYALKPILFLWYSRFPA
jgi:hypothetical protein